MAENDKITIDTPIFAPIHMTGANEIADVFRVSRRAVVRWARDGAPIYLVGKTYQANYGELWDWLKKKSDF